MLTAGGRLRRHHPSRRRDTTSQATRPVPHRRRRCGVTHTPRCGRDPPAGWLLVTVRRELVGAVQVGSLSRREERHDNSKTDSDAGEQAPDFEPSAQAAWSERPLTWASRIKRCVTGRRVRREASTSLRSTPRGPASPESIAARVSGYLRRGHREPMFRFLSPLADSGRGAWNPIWLPEELRAPSRRAALPAIVRLTPSLAPTLCADHQIGYTNTHRAECPESAPRARVVHCGR